MRLFTIRFACLLATLFWVPLGVAGDDEITLNFVAADIESTVKAVGQVTGRNFIIDPRVKGTINIVSGKPVTRELAYQVLVSALRLQGFAVVESHVATKILPEAEAKTQAGPVTARGKSVSGEQIVTQVFHLRYEAAPQVANALKPLIGAQQSITANPTSNTLIITDAADNLRRIERIIASIDVPHGDDPQIVQLKHASAVEVASNLQRLFPAGAGGGLLITADPRANRIVLRADNPGVLARAVTLVSGMDKPESGLGNIRVVYLKNAEATRIAQTLRAILGSETGASGSTPATSTTLAPAPASGAAASSTAPPPVAAAPSGTQTAPSGALLPGSMIQADVGSNALIITAPESVFNNLQNVIAMLDRRRAQVHIEALIVELTAERAAEFGIQWQNLSGLTKTSGTNVVGGTNFGGATQNIASASLDFNRLNGGLNVGVVKGQITIPGLGTITDLRLLARFLETEAQGNILSTPSIMTLDNEEARIVIGQNLPFVTGSYSTTGTGTTVTPFQTYERRDVGLTLKVRPQITEGGVVRVQIYQEASSVQAGSANNPAGPITNKRALESSVLVDDGATIVLGGLIEDSFGADNEKVPGLGDLPLLGNLFRYDNRTRKKTNLMIFLRPHIVREGRDYQVLTDDRYSLLLNEQKKQEQQVKPLWGDKSVPMLEERPSAVRP